MTTATNFDFAAWHESLSGFTSGAWIDAPTATVLQHWHDHALSIWTKAGCPELPVSPQAISDDDGTYADLPQFATWLLRHGPATGVWFTEQCFAAENAVLNDQLNYSSEFWQCCAMFSNTLNMASAFV